jgi:hypothetical protein
LFANSHGSCKQTLNKTQKWDVEVAVLRAVALQLVVKATADAAVVGAIN